MLVTSAVVASAQRTELVDRTKRIEEALLALKWWATSFPRMDIVVCDGSNYDFSIPLMNCIEGTARSGKIECISFQNNIEKVISMGKGWGEGEIVEYSLLHSALLARSDVFAKCTARLWVVNHRQFLDCNGESFGFDFYGRLFPTRLDTRYFMANKSAFVKYLLDAYADVNETAGLDIETIYSRRLCGQRTHGFISPIVPAIKGRSGSMGTLYGAPSKTRTAKELRNKIIRNLPRGLLRYYSR